MVLPAASQRPLLTGVGVPKLGRDAGRARCLRASSDRSEAEKASSSTAARNTTGAAQRHVRATALSVSLNLSGCVLGYRHEFVNRHVQEPREDDEFGDQRLASPGEQCGVRGLGEIERLTYLLGRQALLL